MADREQDPTERAHWFGFFRLCGEPKPVVIAHAACARMIDGSEFVGDLVIPGAETGVGAMLFRRANGWVVAVWTQDEAPGAGRDVTVPAKPEAVFGLMGERRAFEAKDNSVTVKASADVTYLAGKGNIPASLARLVDKSGELSETRWNNRIDGDKPTFAVGTAERPLELPNGPGPEKPTIAVWHEKDAMKVRLRVPAACAADGAGKLFFYFSTRPDRQPEISDWSYFDYELKVAAKDGGFTVTLGNPLFEKGLLRIPAGESPQGISWSGELKDGAIDFAIALPKKALRGFGENRNGLMAGQVNWASGGRSWKLASRNAERNWQWPLWKLEK